MNRRLRIVLCLLLILGGRSIVAQEPSHLWEVFLQRDLDASGIDRISFLNPLDGDVRDYEIMGERYTLLPDAVLFYDPLARQVIQVSPAESPRSHPFLQPDDPAHDIDWVLSNDGQKIAWTVTRRPASGALLTTTYLARLDGSEAREVLVDGPRADGIRALPVAFTADDSTLLMDAYPDGLSRFTAFPQFAGLFALELDSSEVTSLPGEPSCFCGAGFSGNRFLRLRVTGDLRGFDLHLYDLQSGAEQVIPALRLNNFTQAGSIIVSPDGEKAVYALAQIEGFGTPEQSVQTVFVLVDLLTAAQSPLSEPITTYVWPAGWTEDNTSILFTSPQRDGTWKINLSDRELTRVANATYLGKIHAP